MSATPLTQYTLAMQRDVAAFHDAFGSPNGISAPGPLPAERIALRESLIREEGVNELGDAVQQRDVVLAIDAHIDTLYVSLGALVEMGQDAIELANFDDGQQRAFDADRLLALSASAAAANSAYLSMLDSAFRRQDVGRSVEILTAIAYGSLQSLMYAGVDPQPFFDEVQRANMSKLGADGKPVISRGVKLDGFPKGKVLKGPAYVAPDLTSIFERLYVQPARVTVSSEFERGVRAATEAMKLSLVDRTPVAVVTASGLDDIQENVIATTIRDERDRIIRRAA